MEFIFSTHMLHSHEMLQLLLLALSASIRILSVRQINIFCIKSFGTYPQAAELHVYRLLSIICFEEKNKCTECTCSFPVPCEDEALEKFFSRAPLSQLLPMEPDQQHPVPMLFITVLTCGQTHTALYSQENNSASKNNLKSPSVHLKIKWKK